MNGRMSLRLLNQARDNGRDGSVVISLEYDRLKHEYKHPATPWPKEKKLSKYQQRRKELHEAMLQLQRRPLPIKSKPIPRK